MLKVAAALVILGVAGSAVAQTSYPYGGYGNPVGTGSYGMGSNPSSHSVEGYTRQNGTYVAPHYETNPNSTQTDNYSTRGNVNPYTGAYGTRTPTR